MAEGFANIHPYAPKNQCLGYEKIITDISEYLCEITGLDSISLQPNSGAQGEYTGLLLIRAYHKKNGDEHRNICLIPSSAHGTNPASASMCGYEIIEIPRGNDGRLDLQALRDAVGEDTAAMMITNPSTLGLFETEIAEAANIVHSAGGQMY